MIRTISAQLILIAIGAMIYSYAQGASIHEIVVSSLGVTAMAAPFIILLVLNVDEVERIRILLEKAEGKKK